MNVDSGGTTVRFKAYAVAGALLLAVAALAGAGVTLVSGYDRVAHVLVGWAGKSHQEAAFKAMPFTRTSYAVLVALFFVLAMAAACAAYVVNRHFDRAADAMRTGRRALAVAWAAFASRFRMLDPAAKCSLALLAALQVAWCVFRGVTLPVSYDEAWTYMNFSMRPLFASMTYYPAPNNHILFSVITNATRLLPLEPLLTMRLVSLVFALLTIAVLGGIALRYWQAPAVVIGLTLFAFLYPVSIYSVLGRGYMMLLFFAAVCFGSVVAGVIDSKPTGAVLLAYVVSSVLGMYTIPSFLYALASVFVFRMGYALYDRRGMREWLIADMTIACATLLLYAPVFIANGVGAVTANEYVRPMPLADAIGGLPAHLASRANWLFGIDRGGIAIVAAIVAGALILLGRVDRPRRILQAAMLVILVMPPVILVLHRSNPQPRTWIYLMVPLFFLTTGLLDRALSPLREQGARVRWLLPAAVVAVAVLAVQPFDRHYRRDFIEDFEAESLFAGIPSDAIGTIAHDDFYRPFNEPMYFADMLTYHAQLRRREPVLTSRVVPNRPIHVDALVLASADAVPNLHDYTLWRRNDRLSVYLRDAGRPR